MDYLAHGLWSYIFFNKTKDPKQAVFWGLFPDNFSWAIFLIYQLIFFGFSFGRPVLDQIPNWVMTLYGLSHSLVVFAVAALIIYFILGKLPIYLWAWPIEILLDIFTHTKEFLPTPFLWPISEFHVDGLSWATPWFMAVNYIAIAACLAWIFYKRKTEKTNKIVKRKKR